MRDETGKAEAAERDRIAALRAASDAALPSDDVVVTGSPAGETELMALQEELDRGLAVANVGSEATIDAEPDVTHGVVRLLVPPAPTDPQRRYLEHAAVTYGTKIALGTKPGRLHEQACSGIMWCDPPLRGGIKLIYNGALTCTSGFVVESLTDSKKYLSTAAHCVSGGNAWTTLFANGSSHIIGAVHNAGVTWDFAILKIDNPTGWNPGPYIRTASDNTYRIDGWSTSYVGMRVCKSGSTGGSSCGTVTGGEATRDGKPHTFRADYCAQNGDSGGPTFGSGVANGSHIGAYAACDTVYFDIENIGNFNVTVLT